MYLCNSAVNSSDYVVLNDMTISELVRVCNNVVMVSFEVLSLSLDGYDYTKTTIMSVKTDGLQDKI